MELNLFYSLPDDLKYVIYKKVFSMQVLKQIRKEGNFHSFYSPQPGFEWCRDQCVLCYQVLEKVGPRAWSFVKKYTFFYDEADRDSPVYKQIMKEFELAGVSPGQQLLVGMSNMMIIARIGWEGYVQFMQILN